MTENNLSDTIKRLCKKQKVSMSELARRTGQSPQNLAKKIRNKTLRFDEFLELVEVLNARFEWSVITDDNSGDLLPIMEEENVAFLNSVYKAQIDLAQAEKKYLLKCLGNINAVSYSVDSCVDQALKNKNDSKQLVESLQKIKDINAILSSLLSDIRNVDDFRDLMESDKINTEIEEKEDQQAE